MTLSAVVTNSLIGIAAFACLMGMFMPVAGAQLPIAPLSGSALIFCDAQFKSGRMQKQKRI